jgi:hypothetical protein
MIHTAVSFTGNYIGYFFNVGRKHVTQHKNYVSHRLNHRSLLKNYTIKALGPMFYS